MGTATNAGVIGKEGSGGQPMNLIDSLAGLKPKTKEPASARILNGWIAHAERALGSDGGRLGWLVVATIVTAVLQRAVDEGGRCLFLVKGGTMLQYRLVTGGRIICHAIA
jgi:hypothetical protein